MKRWKIVPEVPSNAILEHGVDMVRNPVSPVSSGDRKRSLSAGADRYDDNAKMLFSDVHSPMSSPVCHVDTGFSSPRPSYGSLHTAYPISCLYYSPQKDDEADYDGSSSADLTSHRSSSYRQPADSNTGYDRSTRASTMERFSFPSSRPSSVTSYTEHGQYDVHEQPYLQEGGTSSRNCYNEGNLPIPSCVPPLIKRNRFNLSRYELDEDEEPLATIADQSVVTGDVKPNRFKTQREKLMQSGAEESEESDSTVEPGFEEIFPSHEGEDSLSRDNFMSQRERLIQFRKEHAHLVVIPNQWEGEKNLHKYVAFGNVEDDLRPLGLMMARSALVNDSVTTRIYRSSSSGPSGCHNNSSNPLEVRS